METFGDAEDMMDTSARTRSSSPKVSGGDSTRRATRLGDSLVRTFQKQRYPTAVPSTFGQHRQAGSSPTNHPPLSPFLSWKGEEKSLGDPPSAPAKGLRPLDYPGERDTDLRRLVLVGRSPKMETLRA